MKLHGTIAVEVAGEEILERPGLLARVRKALGGDPDLRTGRMRAALEATAVVDAVRDALIELGATNAVSLVIDDLVVFQDRERRVDDLGDLFLSFHEHAAAIGGGFGVLRLAVEHEEAGLHLVIEVQARTEHLLLEPAVRVVISGRIQAFEPRPGEDAAAYRARVEPQLGDRTVVSLAEVSFESFVRRTRDAIARAMPEARTRVVAAEVRLAPTGERGATRDGRRPAPTDPDYDPHEAYYPSPMLGVLSMMMMGSVVGSMMGPGLASAFGAPGGEASSGGDSGGDSDGESLFDLDW